MHNLRVSEADCLCVCVLCVYSLSFLLQGKESLNWACSAADMIHNAADRSEDRLSADRNRLQIAIITIAIVYISKIFVCTMIRIYCHI